MLHFEKQCVENDSITLSYHNFTFPPSKTVLCMSLPKIKRCFQRTKINIEHREKIKTPLFLFFQIQNILKNISYLSSCKSLKVFNNNSQIFFRGSLSPPQAFSFNTDTHKYVILWQNLSIYFYE